MLGAWLIPASPCAGYRRLTGCPGGRSWCRTAGPGAERPVLVEGRSLPTKRRVTRSSFIEGKQPGAGTGRDRGQRGMRVEGAAGAGGRVNLPLRPTYALMGNKKNPTHNQDEFS